MASMTRTIIRDNRRKVAVAYARFSSNNQREESIDAQLRAIREYCEKEGIELVAEFVDEAVSGKTDNREDFQKMISQLLKGRIQADFVLVHKFNRFARSKFDSALYKKKLRDVDVKVVSVTQKIDDTPEGELLEGFLETIDQYYSANLAAEVRKGLRENALKGKHAGGQVLFGYSLDKDGYYVPNENAKIVKRIFEEYVAGIPKTVICERLNEEGYRNQRGKPFTTRTLYDLLRNEKYIGNYVYTIDKKETIRLDGIIQNPPIDRKLWTEVQELCKESAEKVKGRRQPSGNFYYLTGRAFCGECGGRICANGSKRSGGNGKLNYYYQCVEKVKHKSGCKNPGINKDYIEPKVLNTILSVIMDKQYIKKFAHTAYNEILAMRKKPVVSTVELKKELAQITKKQERLRDLYIDGQMSKDILDEKNGELNRRRYQIEDELEKRKNIIESEDITAEDIEDFITQYIDNIIENYDRADEEFKRIIFHTFLEKVVISKDKIEVHIHTPFSRMDNWDNRGDSVRFTGVLHRLSTVKIVCTLRRKKRNERVDK